MKFLIIFLFYFIHGIASAQEIKFDLSKFEFNKLGFEVSKDSIIKIHGKPKIVFTNYECGGYANDDTHGPYYKLQYAGFAYIGSDNEKFILQEVIFDSLGKVKLYYGKNALTGLMTKSEFAGLLGETEQSLFEQYSDKDCIVIMSLYDDGGKFFFKNGKLIKYEYWSSC